MIAIGPNKVRLETERGYISPNLFSARNSFFGFA